MISFFEYLRYNIFFLKKEKKKRSYINIEEPITSEKELNGFFSNLKRHLRYIRDVHV